MSRRGAIRASFRRASLGEPPSPVKPAPTEAHTRRANGVLGHVRSHRYRVVGLKAILRTAITLCSCPSRSLDSTCVDDGGGIFKPLSKRCCTDILCLLIFCAPARQHTRGRVSIRKRRAGAGWRADWDLSGSCRPKHAASRLHDKPITKRIATSLQKTKFFASKRRARGYPVQFKVY